MNDKFNFRIAELLAALFTGSHSEQDVGELRNWIQENERRSKFTTKILNEDNFEYNEKMLAKFPSEERWQRVKVLLDKTGKSKKLRLWVVRYTAAVVLLLVAVVSSLWLNKDEVEEQCPLPRVLASGTTGARLTTGNGKAIDITQNAHLQLHEEDGTSITTDSLGMVYEASDSVVEQEIWNTMETMTGREYMLVLADGTRIFMNAETQVTFPASFKGCERRIRLSGEAYFEVAKDPMHPFIVETEGAEVRVLGTSFNVRAYEGEQEMVTTLVEGKVAVSDSLTKREIHPGEQAVCMLAEGRIDVRQVEVSLYTAWKSGKFIFHNEPLEKIMTYLSHWYGFECRFLDNKAREVRIGASLNRYEDATPILSMLQKTNLVHVTQVDNVLYISSAK